MLLSAFLRHHHDENVNGQNARTPLTAEQIAEAMQWLNEDGKPVQSRATRRMTDIFGPDAMNKYRAQFLGNPKKGLYKYLDDGIRALDAIANSDTYISNENDWKLFRNAA